MTRILHFKSKIIWAQHSWHIIRDLMGSVSLIKPATTYVEENAENRFNWMVRMSGVLRNSTERSASTRCSHRPHQYLLSACSRSTSSSDSTIQQLSFPKNTLVSTHCTHDWLHVGTAEWHTTLNGRRMTRALGWLVSKSSSDCHYITIITVTKSLTPSCSCCLLTILWHHRHSTLTLTVSTLITGRVALN